MNYTLDTQVEGRQVTLDEVLSSHDRTLVAFVRHLG
ncbi:hypothetical protein C7459_101404 [Tumebacillus permanentifrigoris]|uniref:Uncharacterized protein n=1 Tax=Tumebacillus permanentifrigoris TaxID=378543 RepID=A0A316DFZ5_9BACL|nr:hypothetical protein C7459_101404 [Tumebacillus permanentifrigoris]